MKDIIYSCLRTILLYAAIVLIAIGIHTSNNYMFMCIGGIIIGIYTIITIGGED